MYIILYTMRSIIYVGREGGAEGERERGREGEREGAYRSPMVELFQLWSHEISHAHTLGDPITHQLLHTLRATEHTPRVT